MQATFSTDCETTEADRDTSVVVYDFAWPLQLKMVCNRVNCSVVDELHSGGLPAFCRCSMAKGSGGRLGWQWVQHVVMMTDARVGAIFSI
jgi:hypothetical protein